jgi:hypothetical protein
VKEPRHDDERLSALLAGRLEGPERDELLAYLSTADEDREVFANTAAILREMEEEDAQAEEAGVQVADPPPRRHMLPPSTKSRRAWSRDPRWAVAAVLVGLVALVTLNPFGGGGVVPAGDPVGYALALNSPGEKPAGWVTGIPGASPRGNEAADPTRENSVVAGWFLVRLAVAVQAGDSAVTDSLALQVKDRFDRQGGTALDSLRAHAGEEPDSSLLSLVRKATVRVEAQYDSSFVGLGAWTEAARMAAAGHKAAFFQSEDSRDWLEHARTLTRDDPKARAALESVRATLDAQGERDWETLETDLGKLLDELARP